MGTMFDTTDDPAATFAGLTVEAVAAYANGRWPNYPVAAREFPRANLLEIDVAGEQVGNAGDFEAGDMAYAQAGTWARGRLSAGIKRPVLYFSVSNWPAVMASLSAAAVPRSEIRLWTAHYTGQPHLCSASCGSGVTGTADATQWGSAGFPQTLPSIYGGRNIDVSATADDFWGPPSSPPSSPPFPGRNLQQPPIVSGEDVKTWQTQMAHRGWAIAVDGQYGPSSTQVCREFQTQLHLPVDGVVGPQTWHAAWTAPIT